MAGWVKLWEIPEEHWLREDLRYIGAWNDLIQMAEPKDRKIVRHGTMLQAERGNVYTSLHVLADKWHVSRRFVKHFLEMLEQDGMISVLLADHRGYHLKVNNYAKYQDNPNHKRTTDVTTKGTTDVTTECTTDVTTEGSFFLTSNTEGKEGTEGIESVRKTRRFTPPTQDDVRSYIISGKYPIDPVRFYEYYTARSWKGIKDWKACVRSWVARDNNRPKAKTFDNFDARPNDSGTGMDELLKRLEAD